jgi:1A family penicillin-binding protein
MSNNRSYGFNNSDGGSDKTSKKNPNRLWKFLLIPFKVIGWLFKVLIKMFSKILSWLAFWKNNKRRSKKNSSFKKILVWSSVTIFVFGFLSATIITAWASQNLPSPDQLTKRQVDRTTKIYDRTGDHLLYEIFADKNRTLVELEQVPKELKQGLIATEDDRFYEHYGVRPLSIFRAVFNSVVYGERIQGTSTLTQQLVKNAVLTRERSYIRKLKEVIFAFQLERQYSKEQILKMYFNEVPYGSTNYGVASAAEDYFNKPVNKLSLAESATLAGLPKAPTTFLNDPKQLKQRRDFVLYRMQQEDYISKQEMNKAQKKPLNLSRNLDNIKAPHFVLHVRKKLVDKFGEKKVDTGGLRVKTTLDWDKQKIARDVVSSTGSKVLNQAGANNTSLVAMNPKTSGILAMIGSKNFQNQKIDGKFNVATEGKRQPGSSFKPIIYTAAFEKGYTPQTILYDVKTDFAPSSNQEYIPKNYDLKERGPMTMRKALQGSANIPAVKTMYLVGNERAINFAERLGYSTLSKGNFGLSLVLGGGEVKLLEHTNAYATLANGGVNKQSKSILKVTSPNGKVLLDNNKNQGERVLENKYTKLITDVLSDNQARAYAFGRDNVLTLPDRPVAAKTGTTNNYVDSWTMGYTPNLVTGVWAGNTNNSPMTRGYGGSKVAGPIWNEFMKRTLKNKQVNKFSEKPEITAEKPVLTASKGKIKLKVNEVTGKIAASSTPDHLVVEKTFVPPHSILHYVKKDNPREGKPDNPSQDPQYKVWEQAIKDWKKRMKQKKDMNLTFEEPPTKKDSGYSKEFSPSLTVVYPKPSSTISSQELNTDIRVTAPRGIKRVVYKLDGVFVNVADQHPFNLNYSLEDMKEGKHTLVIIAEEQKGYRKIKKINFTYKKPSVATSTITQPPNLSTSTKINTNSLEKLDGS